MSDIRNNFNDNINNLAKASNQNPIEVLLFTNTASSYDFLLSLGLNLKYYSNTDLVALSSLDNYTEMLATRTSSSRSIFSAYYLKKTGQNNSSSIKSDIIRQAAALGKEAAYSACFGAPFSYLEAVDPLGRVYKDTFGIRREETWITKPNNEPALVSSNTDSKVFTAYIKVGMVGESAGRKIIDKVGEIAEKSINTATNSEGKKLTDRNKNVGLISSFTLHYYITNEMYREKDTIWEQGQVVPFNKFIYRALLRVIEEHTSQSISGIPYGNPTLDEATRNLQTQNMDIIKNKIKTIFGEGSMPFFKFICSEETIITDSYQNMVGDSTIKSWIEGASKHAREISFMTGGGDAATVVGTWLDQLKDKSKANGGEVTPELLRMTKSGIDSLRNTLDSVVGSDLVDMFLRGNSLIYPSVWVNSSIIKIITMQIRLYSPYGDWNSIFTNVLIPYFTLMGLALPRQTSPSFISFPFCFSLEIPGLCQSDFTIIQNFSFRRGGRYDAWSEASFMRGIDITVDCIPLKPTFGLPEEAYTAEFTPSTPYTKENADQDPRNKIYGSEINDRFGDKTFANELRTLSGSFIITDNLYTSEEKQQLVQTIFKKTAEKDGVISGQEETVPLNYKERVMTLNQDLLNLNQNTIDKRTQLNEEQNKN